MDERTKLLYAFLLGFGWADGFVADFIIKPFIDSDDVDGLIATTADVVADRQFALEDGLEQATDEEKLIDMLLKA
jgi:hypothetical protein